MPRRKSGIATARADKKKHARNVRVKTGLKKAVKQFQALVEAKKNDEAAALLKKLYSLFDKAAKKGVIPRNASSRKKSRFKRSIARITKAS